MKIEKQFSEIISLIKAARYNAFKAVNTELINLYWEVGKYISRRIDSEGWGKSTVKQLADFIQKQEPELKGFSDKNLWRMKQFYEAYSNNPKLSPLVRELSWTHNLIIFSRANTAEETAFYLNLCIAEKLSKRELERQINSSLFEPGHLGKINFYLEALDRDVKKPHENPSIGVLLCKNKNEEVVEYAMSRNMSPTLISQYTIALPDKKLLQAKLHELYELYAPKTEEE